MSTTMERPASGRTDPDERLRHENRRLRIVAVVAAVVALGFGVLALLAALADDDASSEDGAGAMPDEIQVLVDEFLEANENLDYGALQSLVTDDFRRPLYEDASGIPTFRDVDTIEDLAFMELESDPWEIVTVGDPIVHGDGPWFVSMALDWNRGIQYVSVYTLVVVDDEGTLRIDDAYFAGYSRPLVED